MGKIYDIQGRFKSALARFQVAAQAEPADPENDYLIARAYRHLGDPQKADPYMQKAAAVGYPLAVQDLAQKGSGQYAR
jgi:Flp pilus assembly protein TadD